MKSLSQRIKEVSEGLSNVDAPRDTRQNRNDAGGYSYGISCFDALQRWIILGTENSTMYLDKPARIDKDAAVLNTALKENALGVIKLAEKLNHEGRVIKVDQSLFAIAAASVNTNAEVRRQAFDAALKVCRIATHLYQFIEYRKLLGHSSFSYAMRKFISKWLDREDLAYQVSNTLPGV